MGTADYCALVVVLLAGLVAIMIRQEERRLADRRKPHKLLPGGLERRSGKDRRRHAIRDHVGWGLEAVRLRLGRLFKK
jgi:hypothetical protein